MLGLDVAVGRHGGSVRYLHDLRNALSLEGLRVAVVVLGEPSRAEPGVVVAGGHEKPLPVRVYRYTRTAERALRASDVVDVHFALYGLIPSLIATHRGIPLIVHFHGPWAAEADAMQKRHSVTWIRRAIERAVYRRADAAVAVSHAFANVLIGDYGVPEDRVVVIPPAVDLEGFAPLDRAAARGRIGIAPDEWVVVAARRLVPRTGVDVLIRAWAQLEPLDGARLLVSGVGPELDALKLLADRLDVAGSVTFLGHTPDASMPSLYAAADVSVLPSRSLEGFGLSALESLACGTPVLASDLGGLREALGPFASSCIVPAADPHALAARLRRAREGELPSRAACRRYAERFDRKRLAAAHMGIIDQVIGRHGSP